MSMEAFRHLIVRHTDASTTEPEKPLPRFAENMLRIGAIVSWQGGQHPLYPLNLIHSVDSSPDAAGFDGEVYLEPADDPQIVLNEHKAPEPDGYRRNDLSISYRPDTRVSLRIHDLGKYPQARLFEKPQQLPPGNLFSVYENSMFFWMTSNLLGPNTVQFLDDVTSQGLYAIEKTVASVQQDASNKPELYES